MSNNVTIALDAMGGDNAPSSVIGAANLVLSKNSNKNLGIHYSIYALEGSLDEILDRYPLVKKNSEIFFTKDAVLPEDRPATAIRRRKESSMYKAVLSAKMKEVDCIVSAGNTGALMAISKMLLGMLQNIYRPAIITTIPTKKEELVVLDLGANLDCDSDVLHQFACMGSAFASAVFQKESPRVGLLNIGSEETKGTDAIKETWHLLKDPDSRINFVGYSEPDKMLSGDLDVVVTDGFNGNIMLKTAEGFYYLIKSSVADVMQKSILGKICNFFLKKRLQKSLNKFNPRLRNGAMLIGLDGIVIKAHGSSDEISFANAIEVAINAASNNINTKICANIDGI